MKDKSRRLILLAGVPAAGKSCFARWLKDTHDAVHIDVDNDSARVNALNATSLDDLIGKVKELGSLVVFDWGFPVGELPTVSAFKNAGAELWWFDADHDAARKAFEKREEQNRIEGRPWQNVTSFDAQYQRVTESWSEIEPLFAGRIIHALQADGQRADSESVWREMEKGRR